MKYYTAAVVKKNNKYSVTMVVLAKSFERAAALLAKDKSIKKVNSIAVNENIFVIADED